MPYFINCTRFSGDLSPEQEQALTIFAKHVK